jgi:hypothetical protein
VRAATAHTGLAILFFLLATANSGGYRYGVSDQAFYVPAVMQAANPATFPRDAELLATQTGFMASDDLMALAGRLSGLEWPVVFLIFYAATLVVLYAGAVTFTRACGFSWWATGACLLLMTFRHRIAKTGANSLEGYMHPRELAFGVGLLALGLAVRGRYAWALTITALAALVHPTTALWFGAAVAVAAFAGRPSWRRALLAVGVAAFLVVGLAAALGPLGSRFVVMDETWMTVLADKDYLFPLDWPAYAWLSNLGYAAVIAIIFRRRHRLGLLAAGEGPLMAGLLALLAAFLISIPLTEFRVALAVQLQVTRVFWLLDFVTAAYVAWWLTSLRSRGRSWAAAVVGVLIVFSAGRGVYLLTIEHPARQLVQVSLPDTPWVEAMTWVGEQPGSWHVLADPGHAWKYGASVRAAAGRDTLLESTKDSAMALYDRDIAGRVAERTAALGDFPSLGTEDVRRLAAAYALDVLVAEVTHRFDLPVLYRNAGFVVYDLR